MPRNLEFFLCEMESPLEAGKGRSPEAQVLVLTVIHELNVVRQKFPNFAGFCFSYMRGEGAESIKSLINCGPYYR